VQDTVDICRTVVLWYRNHGEGGADAEIEGDRQSGGKMDQRVGKISRLEKNMPVVAGKEKGKEKER